jgi:predicted nucleotidyltransferase
MEKNIQDILTHLRTLLPYLKEKYDVDFIEAFGSYIRNQQNAESDLDILVSYTKTPGLLKFIELKNFLTDNIGINVDLIMKDSLKPIIGQNILQRTIRI